VTGAWRSHSRHAYFENGKPGRRFLRSWEQPKPIEGSSAGSGSMENIMTRSARVGLAAVLLLGGATMAMAQNGPATGGYPPARWNPNFYGNYGYSYYPRYYGYYPVYPAVPGYWNYYQTSAPGRGNNEESTR
jgi:hypothetical protein